jgi:uncharacterized repeat protein (TIGR03803 family)
MGNKNASCPEKTCRATVGALMLAAITVGLAAGVGAQTEKVLYSFKNTPDGANPQAGVVLRGGNLYGTTTGGGAHGRGTVFELRHTPNGWVEKVLHSFTGGTDGGFPIGAVTFDKSGNLYGTATNGGSTGGSCGSFGCGVVFELKPSSSGWKETVLHSFLGGSDGSGPASDLVFDKLGNFYGVASSGVVFEFVPSGTSWNYAVISNVPGGPGVGKLAIDSKSNLYGATYQGGNSGCVVGPCGTLFELTPSGGSWTTTTLYNFLPSNDGSNPFASVSLGPGGLYGTADLGGTRGAGAVFKLKHGNGVWSESVLYAFTDGSDGGFPAADVVLDKSGNLYSWALGGNHTCAGSPYDLPCGVVFELILSQGTWTEKVLHSFQPTGGDGWNPAGSPILDGTGNFYGTTYNGGTHGGPFGYGTVFEITP